MRRGHIALASYCKTGTNSTYPYTGYGTRTRGAAAYFGVQRHQVERPLMRFSELYVADLLAVRRKGVRLASKRCEVDIIAR